jgi:hypothetical protein
MAWWKRSTSMSISFAILFALGVGCGSANDSKSDDDDVGPFVPSAADEAIDPNDPPIDPDPDDPEETLTASVTTKGFSSTCPATPTVLSPKGLTFVLHLSREADVAAREVGHLTEVRRYLRTRDVFMIEHGSPYVENVRAMFPCNRIDFIAYPDEMGAALSTGDGVDGIAVDWEGASVTANGQAWSEGALHDYANKIHAQGKDAGFVPAWGGASFDDAEILHASDMDYELAQTQGSCVAAPENFAGAAKDALRQYMTHSIALRRLGFEISMDSFEVASNHVDAARAADCTRKAYGKGARAIYIYGNGADHLHDYFHALGTMGVRTPR